MVELVVTKKKAVRNAAPVVDDESIDIEGLGVFYLGRKVDPDSGKPTSAPLLVDARRFTTHAVCVGMTGSGKTGLLIDLIEEAAIDGIPAICIDPKGDLGNLMLTFPQLAATDFKPWLDPADETLEELRQRWEALQEECEAEVAALSATVAADTVALREMTLAPRKSDLVVKEVALIWIPGPAR